VVDSERGILPRDKIEFASTTDAEHPEVGSEINAFRDLRAVELLVGNRHLTWLSASKICSTTPHRPETWTERRLIQWD
jgi:hypothetical protein